MKALEHLESFVDVHLVVEGAVISSSERRLPAFIVQALGHSHHVRLVLSKVESLARMDLAPHSLVKVLVGDLAITILIELREDCLELLIREEQAPLLEV